MLTLLVVARPAVLVGASGSLTAPLAASSHLVAFGAVLVFGLAIGLLGHLMRSRTLILAGILVIGLASAYFSFVLRPSGG